MPHVIHLHVHVHVHVHVHACCLLLPSHTYMYTATRRTCIYTLTHTYKHTCTYSPLPTPSCQAVGALLRSGQFPQSFLQRSDMPHTALLLAAKSGHNEVISILIKHGFDINRKLPGANGNCLHEAALYGKVETVKYLLQVSTTVYIMYRLVHVAICVYVIFSPVCCLLWLVYEFMF